MMMLRWSQRLPTPVKRPIRPECLGIFPTVSYRKCRLRTVRSDVTGARKGSSYAKHCIFLIPLAAGNGFKKIPLPAPADLVSSGYARCLVLS